MARVGKSQSISSYYLILGLKRSTSEEEIKERYRELAKIYHPDVNHSLDAEEKFKAINEAYKYLISHVGNNGNKSCGDNGKIFNEVQRTNKTTKPKSRDIKNITDKLLKNISKSVNREVHKNLQKFMKDRNHIIYTAAVKGLKKEMKRRF